MRGEGAGPSPVTPGPAAPGSPSASARALPQPHGPPTAPRRRIPPAPPPRHSPAAGSARLSTASTRPRRAASAGPAPRAMATAALRRHFTAQHGAARRDARRMDLPDRRWRLRTLRAEGHGRDAPPPLPPPRPALPAPPAARGRPHRGPRGGDGDGRGGRSVGTGRGRGGRWGWGRVAAGMGGMGGEGKAGGGRPAAVGWWQPWRGELPAPRRRPTGVGGAKAPEERMISAGGGRCPSRSPFPRARPSWKALKLPSALAPAPRRLRALCVRGGGEGAMNKPHCFLPVIRQIPELLPSTEPDGRYPTTTMILPAMPMQPG